MSETVNVVIPAAGAGHRMKSYGPKASISLVKGGECVISRQLRLLRTRFKLDQIVVVVGFRSTRVSKNLPKSAKTIYNKDHATTNVAWSISLGLSAITSPHPTLVVYGDLVFTPLVVRELDISTSSLLVDRHGQMRHDEVGANVVGDQIMSLSYGVPVKWAQIAVLHDSERKLFIEHASTERSRRYLGYEILNLTMDNGANYAASFIESGSIVEIDTSRDIKEAKKLVSPR